MANFTSLDFAYYVSDFKAFVLEVAILVRDGWTREELFEILTEKAESLSEVCFNVSLKEEQEAIEKELQSALKKVVSKASSGDPKAKKAIDAIWELY